MTIQSLTDCLITYHYNLSTNSASILVQHIYQDMNFNSPFFITYLENTLFVLYLPNYQLWMLLKSNGYFKNEKDDDDNDDDDDDDGVRTVDGYMHIESNATMLTLMNPIHGHDYHNINNNNNNNSSSSSIGCGNEPDEIIDHHHDDNLDDNHSHDIRGNTRSSSILRSQPSSPLNKTSSYTHIEVIYMAAYIAPFWFMANCLYYYSLEWTSVSSSTIIR